MAVVIPLPAHAWKRGAIFAAVAAALICFCFTPALRTTVAAALGNRPEKQPFADAVVIAAGAEAFRTGLDPLVQNPGDPWGRPMNYPRIVARLASATGLDLNHATLLGGSFALAAIVGLGALFLNWPDADFRPLLLAGFSPAFLFGLERGNLDLAVFAVLTVACYARRDWLAAVVIAPLCAVKLYPAFVCTQAFSSAHSRSARWRWLVAGLLCVTYVWSIRHDLPLIYQATPRQAPLSWGTQSLPGRLHWAPAVWISSCSGIVALAAGIWSAKANRENAPASAHASSAAAGALIFAGCYFLGSNYDYRRIFLCLLLPFLVLNARTPAPPRRTVWREWRLAAVVLALWSPAILFWSTRVGLRGGWIFGELAVLLALAACGSILVHTQSRPRLLSS